jgi:S-DNA-T family DNA segregation ATPase FtsK/SpoIIIE
MARSKSKRSRKRKDPSDEGGLFARGRASGSATAERLKEIGGLALFGFAFWLGLSLASWRSNPAAGEGWNWGGQAGWYFANWVYLAIGYSGYFLVFLGLAWGAILVARKRVGWPLLRLAGTVAFLVSSAFLFELLLGVKDGAPGGRSGAGLPYGPGGYLSLELVGSGVDGSRIPPILIEKLGNPGLLVLLILSTLISFMLATEMAFYPAAIALRDWVVEHKQRDGESFPVASLAWFGRLFSGLWSFLRGSDLDAPMESVVLAPPATKRRKRTAPSEEETEVDGDALPSADGALGDDVLPERDVEPLVGQDDDWEEADDDVEVADDDDDEDEDDDDDDTETTKTGDDDDEKSDDYDEDLDDWNESTLTPGEAPATRRAGKALPAAAMLEPPSTAPGDWKLPSLDLLEAPGGANRDDERTVEAQARRLENALGSFRVEAVVVGAKVGPAVTLYELEVTQGTRLNKVTQLSQEIAAALRAKSVRIIAPIPGKSTIGIEVPNEKRRTVRLAELVSPKAYDKNFAALPLFLGMDAEGNTIVEDLARMPHLLIAGTTGSGKSVCINAILASLLLTRSPHDVQLILIDPKMVELQMFAKVPHLMLPVVSDMRQATNVLLWAVEKMEGRYDLFQKAGVRNIKAYNALGEQGLRDRMGEEFHEERTPRHVPYIVMVIDEMADLMMASKKEAELSITRLAQKSRAVGIHVIVATQRPSTDVITGVLKGNLPTRIAFQVASKVDSRVILDSMGAEKLLGQGDMLYNPPNVSQIRRVQGALVEDHEIQAVVDFVTKESVPTFNQELVQTATGSAPAGSTAPGVEQDDLYDEAVRIVLKTKRGSASLLQRALGIGYTRASRLIDIMTSEGVVGDHKGSKAREVLLTLEDWEQMQAASTPQGSHHE